MKKRMLFAFVAAVMCAALCLTGCGKKDTGGGDPYVPGSGFLSEDTYSTVDEAIGAFLKNEVSFWDEYSETNMANAELIGKTETGDLTEEEKAELKITNEQRKGIISAKKYNVKYAETVFVFENPAFDSPEADPEDQEPVPQITNSEMTIYLLGYADGYRYFTPAPKVGDTLTKSYFDSIFDYDLYKNCTVTASGSGLEEYVPYTYTQTSKFTENVFTDYFEETGTYEGKSYTYCKETGDGANNLLVIDGNYDGEKWEYSNNGDYGYSSFVEFAYSELFEDLTLDAGVFHYLFKKAATGFELRKPGMFCRADGYLEKYSATITNGKIVSVSSKVLFGDSDSDTITYTLTNFGTTTITETDFPTGFHDFADDILTA